MFMLNRDGQIDTFFSDGAVIDLGGRRPALRNLPGYIREPVVLFDTDHNQVFTGDFVFRHLSGIIVFALTFDLATYKTNSTRLLQLTNMETQSCGAHGVPRFGRDWLTLLDGELDKMAKGYA